MVCHSSNQEPGESDRDVYLGLSGKRNRAGSPSHTWWVMYRTFAVNFDRVGSPQWTWNTYKAVFDVNLKGKLVVRLIVIGVLVRPIRVL